MIFQRKAINAQDMHCTNEDNTAIKHVTLHYVTFRGASLVLFDDRLLNIPWKDALVTRSWSRFANLEISTEDEGMPFLYVCTTRHRMKLYTVDGPRKAEQGSCSRIN